jgi:hypothetical protein
MTTTPRDNFNHLAYLASERGGTLTASEDHTTFTVALATDGAVVLGPGASQAATEAWCNGVPYVEEIEADADADAHR